MKQIGLSLHNFHDTKKTFPPGALSNTSHRFGSPEYAYFLYQAMPFMELTTIYDRFANFTLPAPWTVPPTTAGWIDIHDKPISVFLCPSDMKNPTKDVGSGTKVPASNYLGMFSGFNDLESDQDVDARRAAFGLAPPNKGRRMSDFNDGLSNTMMVAEYLTGTAHDFRGAVITHRAGSDFLHALYTPNTSVPDNLLNFAGFCDADDNLPAENLPCAPAAQDGNFASARSRHSGGVNVLLGDGSVRMVNNSVDLNTWRAVTFLADGQPITGLQ
jgi:prepilin-type processing-associated H-X9-DG protein